MDNEKGPLAIRFLIGERLYLRPLTEADLDGGYLGWFNDAEVCAGNSHHVLPYTRELALEYIRQSARTRDELVLAMVLRDNDRHIGNIALQKIHPLSRSADLSIVIGEKTAWGQGLGLEAGRLLCTHAFLELNLNRIACATYENNTAMMRLAASLGMQEEGRRRQAAFKSGRYLDIIEFGVLGSEYQGAMANK